jgi:hypothetical protein
VFFFTKLDLSYLEKQLGKLFLYQGIFQDDLIFGNIVKNCFNEILGVSS